jgi:hypothetical protein
LDIVSGGDMNAQLVPIGGVDGIERKRHLEWNRHVPGTVDELLGHQLGITIADMLHPRNDHGIRRHRNAFSVPNGAGHRAAGRVAPVGEFNGTRQQPFPVGRVEPAKGRNERFDISW